MEKLMNKRSSDDTAQNDPLMRLANQSSIEEVTCLFKRSIPVHPSDDANEA